MSAGVAYQWQAALTTRAPEPTFSLVSSNPRPGETRQDHGGDHLLTLLPGAGATAPPVCTCPAAASAHPAAACLPYALLLAASPRAGRGLEGGGNCSIFLDSSDARVAGRRTGAPTFRCRGASTEDRVGRRLARPKVGEPAKLVAPVARMTSPSKTGPINVHERVSYGDCACAATECEARNQLDNMGAAAWRDDTLDGVDPQMSAKAPSTDAASARQIAEAGAGPASAHLSVAPPAIGGHRRKTAKSMPMRGELAPREQTPGCAARKNTPVAGCDSGRMRVRGDSSPDGDRHPFSTSRPCGPRHRSCDQHLPAHPGHNHGHLPGGLRPGVVQPGFFPTKESVYDGRQAVPPVS